MISPETRAQIRRYFYAEHWKIGTIARELGVHPDAVRNAIEAERFRSSAAAARSIVDPYAEFIRQTLDQHPRLRATRIYQMIRDRGYTGSVVQLRRAVARLRPPVREAVPAPADLSRRAGASRLGALRSRHGGPRPPRPVLLRDDVVLFARPVSGVLLRSDDGELPARPRACLSSLERPAARDSLRQSQERRAGAARQPDSFQSPPDRAERALSLRATALPGARRQSERARGTGHSLCARFLLGGPHLHHAGRMQSPGLAVARSGGASAALAGRRQPHRRRGLRRRTAAPAASAAALLSAPTGSRPCARTRPSMCASISTITPSRRKPSAAR